MDMKDEGDRPEVTPLVAEVQRQALEQKIKGLIASGYEQTSYKYRTLNRVPPGKTGLEALREVNPNLAQHFLDNANRMAVEQYMRCHSRDQVELTREEFQEYRRQTGRKYHEP